MSLGKKINFYPISSVIWTCNEYLVGRIKDYIKRRVKSVLRIVIGGQDTELKQFCPIFVPWPHKFDESCNGQSSAAKK